MFTSNKLIIIVNNINSKRDKLIEQLNQMLSSFVMPNSNVIGELLLKRGYKNIVYGIGTYTTVL